MMKLLSRSLWQALAKAGIALGFLGLATPVWAGNVQVALEGALLKITGSNTADVIALVQSSTGDVFVQAGTDTTVNGRSSVTFRRVNLNAVELKMGAGNDSVSTRGLVIANDFYVNLGAGNDRLTTSGPVVVGANWAIEGQGGSDTIRLIDATVGEDLYIDGGLGVLDAQVIGLQGGKSLTVISDEANDLVTIEDSTVLDTLSIETKGGNDRITISGAMAFDLAISSDIGADSISITDFFAEESIGVFTSSGNDQLNMVNVIAGTTLKISVDTGDDWVSGQRVVAGTDAVLEGGDGRDTLINLGISGGIKTEIKEFEIIRR